MNTRNDATRAKERKKLFRANGKYGVKNHNKVTLCATKTTIKCMTKIGTNTTLYKCILCVYIILEKEKSGKKAHIL